MAAIVQVIAHLRKYIALKDDANAQIYQVFRVHSLKLSG
jgi:hypothetical protein